MKTMALRKRTFFVVMGIFILFALVLITGATNSNTDQIGRYRMGVVIRNSFTDIFVIDTTTGVVKYLGKDEGKPFDQVQGK